MLQLATGIIPYITFVMLFITFCKVNPRDMRLRRWHVWLMLFQVSSCSAIAAFLHYNPGFSYRLLAEGAMICFICPTATAAAVITRKLGGNETTVTSYTMLSNSVAAIFIPLLFPLVETTVETSFYQQCLSILQRVFPMLICPFLTAWALRVFLPSAHHFIVTRCKDLAFYLWTFTLMIVTGQALYSLVHSGVDVSLQIGLGLISLAICIVQFILGKFLGYFDRDVISAGQGLAQKNTIFAIWIAHIYLSPVVGLAPSGYILWQNIINAWQLRRKQKQDVLAAQTEYSNHSPQLSPSMRGTCTARQQS